MKMSMKANAFLLSSVVLLSGCADEKEQKTENPNTIKVDENKVDVTQDKTNVDTDKAIQSSEDAISDATSTSPKETQYIDKERVEQIKKDKKAKALEMKQRSQQIRPQDNLNQRKELMAGIIKYPDKVIKGKTHDKVKQFISDAYKDAKPFYRINNGTTPELDSYVNKYYNHDYTNTSKPFMFMQYQLTPDLSSLKVTEYDKNVYQYMLDFKTPEGKNGGTVFGYYYDIINTMDVISATVSSEGKKYGDMESMRQMKKYDQIK